MSVALLLKVRGYERIGLTRGRQIWTVRGQVKPKARHFKTGHALLRVRLRQDIGLKAKPKEVRKPYIGRHEVRILLSALEDPIAVSTKNYIGGYRSPWRIARHLGCLGRALCAHYLRSEL